jgi:hypothetical protein
MFRRLRERPVLMLGAGLTLGLLVGVGMMIGALCATSTSRTASSMLPETLLHAAASHSGESMAMATGMIDEDAEGLFILDYLTGELQCWAMYPRTGQFGGIFKANVIADLGVQQGKKPNYVIVTGGANFVRGGGANTPAMSAVYVADANTGNFAAYGLAWNRTMARAGTPQQGPLILLDKNKARTIEIRE